MLPSASPIFSCRTLRAIEADHVAATPALMERAGQAAARLAYRLLDGHPGSVLVLAGPGNNGGDGFVLARELRQMGIPVVVVSAARADRYPPDAALARQRWLDAGGQVLSDFIGTQWSLAVDAMFGIGLTRSIEGIWADWIARFNTMTCPRLALDVPSGLDAETGALLGPCVQATHTTTFIGLKPGLLTLDGPDQCGEITVFDLDLPLPVAPGQLLGRSCFAHLLRPRQSNVHKGSFGSAGIIGGASGMQGAALLAARAALHLGPGKVFLGMLADATAGIDPAFPEIMWRSPADLLMLASALGIGPGLGKGPAALAELRRSLGFAGPLLVDADALNLIAEDPVLASALARRSAPTVITPHPAEAARLLHCTVAEIQSNRVEHALELARRTVSIVVLKGHGSVIATPAGNWFINPNGHAGMACGGTGDVLSGLLVALLAQGWPVLEATLCSVHLHAAAADALAAQGIGPVGLIASEIAPAARILFNQWLHQ